MPRYDKFHSLFEDILAQITLDFSSKFELRSVLKERAASAIIFAIKLVCYSSRITIIVNGEMLTNRYCLKYLGFLLAFDGRRMGTIMEVLPFVF